MADDVSNPPTYPFPVLPPYTAMPFDPAMQQMPPPITMPPAKPNLLSQVGLDKPTGAGSASPDTDQLYKYALLSAMLGSAGAGIGQAFRPWVRPPQPLPSPQAPQMPVTAGSSIAALAQRGASRKGY